MAKDKVIVGDVESVKQDGNGAKLALNVDLPANDGFVLCEVCGHVNPIGDGLCEMCSNYLFTKGGNR